MSDRSPADVLADALLPCNAPGPTEDCPRHAHLAEKWRTVGRIGWSLNVPTYRRSDVEDS